MAEIPARCPDCGYPLHRAYRPSDSMLNQDQFDAIRAGDYYCTQCPSNGRSKSTYRYFWESELTAPAHPEQPKESAPLQGTAHEAPSGVDNLQGAADPSQPSAALADQIENAIDWLRGGRVFRQDSLVGLLSDVLIALRAQPPVEAAGVWLHKTEPREVRFEEPITPSHWHKLYVVAAPVAPRVQQPQLEDTLAPVLEELRKALAKFPTWPTDPLHAVAVLGEEYGELTKATLQLIYEPHKTSFEEVTTEAIQTAAMALRFVASLHIYQFVCGKQHEQSLRARLSGETK